MSEQEDFSKITSEEVGVSLVETFMAPPAVDPQEEIDAVIGLDVSALAGDLVEGSELVVSELPCEECPEDRELRVEQNTDYSQTREDLLQ